MSISLVYQNEHILAAVNKHLKQLPRKAKLFLCLYDRTMQYFAAKKVMNNRKRTNYNKVLNET